MDELSLETTSPAETEQLAEKLASFLLPGDLLTLEGDLGAGKTTFTKGLAKGLGIKKTVNSPTFTIIKEYEGRLPLYHIDVYRLENSDEDLGFEEYFDGDGVTVIEWATFIHDLLPNDYLNIKILHRNGTKRTIRFDPNGERYERLCKEFFQL